MLNNSTSPSNTNGAQLPDLVKKLIEGREPKPRLLSEMREILRKEEAGGNDTVLYDVYRNTDSVNNLRYDLTFLYPNRLENELTKTFGHYHEGDMMEVMEVLEGKVLWLLQKYETDPKKISEIYLIEAKKGEKAVFPAGFGAISINPEEDKAAILSNWVSNDCVSDYTNYEQLRGAGYYIFKNKNGEIEAEKNPNFESVPELIKLKPKEVPEIGITFDRPLYNLKETPEQLEFLGNPEKYKDILTIEKCYEKI